MITQETRERMDNLIRCIQAKLDGKTIEWFDTVQQKWHAFAEDDWCFMSTSQLRIAPEPQEKLKRWIVYDPDKHMSDHYSDLKYAENYRATQLPNGTIYELTETARIEPKKREPRRVWINDTTFRAGYTFAYDKPDNAKRDNPDNLPLIEFVEVVK